MGWRRLRGSDLRSFRWAKRTGVAQAGLALHAGRRSGGPSPAALAPALAAPLLALDEVDDQRDPLQPPALAQAILDEVGVVARDALARVDLDREARRALARLRHVDELEAVVLLGRRLADLLDLGQEAVQLRRRDAAGRAVGERHRLDQQALHVAAGL